MVICRDEEEEKRRESGVGWVIRSVGGRRGEEGGSHIQYSRGHGQGQPGKAKSTGREQSGSLCPCAGI